MDFHDILDIALLGDSDTEDEDVEEAILLFNERENLGPRQVLYGRFNFLEISSIEIKYMCRFDKKDIPKLAQLLQIPQYNKTNDAIPFTGVEGLCILLRRLAYPNRLVDLEMVFGYSYKALSSICNTTMNIIRNNKGALLNNIGNLTWLNQRKFEEYAQAVSRKSSPLNNVWGFIDGTVRPICRPSINQELYYSGHKKVHCVKYQSVLCPDGLIISLKGAYPGHQHDSGIFRESQIYEELQQFTVFGNRKYKIYGDQGYGLRELLIRPFSAAEIIGRPERQIFNNSMALLRLAVEWGFSKTIKEFAFLDFKKNQKLLLQDIESMYYVGTLLANCHTCFYGSQQSVYFNINPPTLEEYLGNQ